MKPIHVYKLAVYLKDDAEDLNAEEIKEAIKNYIGIKVIISSVGIRSAEFNLRRK